MINKNKFTIKILLLSVLPILILFIALKTLHDTRSHTLSSKTSAAVERSIYDIYTKVIKMKSQDIINEVSFKCSGIDELIERVKNKKIGQAGFAFLMHSNGDILHISKASSNLLQLKQKTDSFNLSNSENTLLSTLPKSIKKSKEFSIYTFSNSDGSAYFITFQKLKNIHLENSNENSINKPLYLSLFIPLNEYLGLSSVIRKPIISNFGSYLNNMIILSIIIVLIVLVLATFFAFKETKQIRLINDGIMNIKKRKFENSIEVVTSDDLGDLAQTFNDLSIEIQKTYKELEDNALTLEEKVKSRTEELENKNELLEKLAVTDTLTGLYNRSKLDEVLKYEFKRSKRYNSIFGVILIDIDFFKKVNDTHGHQVGDTVLCEFANLLQKTSRESDTVGRWGGEEFLIIVENIDQDGIVILAEKMRTMIDTFNFSVVKHKTASFGVSIYQTNDEVNTIIARADEALYKAKNGGRNRVEFL